MAVSTGRKRESLVWDFFDYDSPKAESVCKIILQVDGRDQKCGKIVKGKNPTNLKRHLQAAHEPQHKQVCL